MKLVIIIFLVFFVLSGICRSQSSTFIIPAAENKENNSVIKLQKESKESIDINKEESPSEITNLQLQLYTTIFLHNTKKETKPAPNLISSFKNNIHFAGFWDHYAIINFTPDVFIKPADFISFYASHNTSVYVPVSMAKKYFTTLALQSAAVVAVDNSVKVLFPQNNIIPSIVGFVLKTLITRVLKKPAESQLIEFRYYYYSLSIRF